MKLLRIVVLALVLAFLGGVGQASAASSVSYHWYTNGPIYTPLGAVWQVHLDYSFYGTYFCRENIGAPSPGGNGGTYGYCEGHYVGVGYAFAGQTFVVDFYDMAYYGPVHLATTFCTASKGC